MTAIHDDFPALSSLIAGCLHQDMDMDMEYDTFPQALAGYARFTESDEKQKLFDDMKAFLERHHNDLEGEFSRLYWFDFTPAIIGQTVPQFFDMLRTILDDPESYVRFDSLH
ncbi:contact-dependent growth inhibition system immunity protein [Agrobacterium sp. CG674]